MKITWQEPVVFAQAMARSRGRGPSRGRQWIIAAAGVAVTALLILGFERFFFWLHQKDLGVPIYTYFIAPVFIGLFLGFLPYMIAVIPATAIMNDDGMHRNKPIGTTIQREFWPWESISSLSIETVRLGKADYRVLAVRRFNEDAATQIGLGAASVEELSKLATQQGKPLTIVG